MSAARSRPPPTSTSARRSTTPPGGSTHLGFWIYLMSDCLIFAVLFATYGVLGASLAGGPGPRDLFDLPLVALNTTLLLISSITYGFAMLAMHRRRPAADAAVARRHRPLRRRLRRGRALRVRPPDPRGRRPAALGLPLGLLRAGRHPRAARHLRHRLADRADGAGDQARADRAPTSGGSPACRCSGTSSTWSGSGSSPSSTCWGCCDERRAAAHDADAATHERVAAPRTAPSATT